MSTSEVRNHLACGAEHDAGVAPFHLASGNATLVEPAGRVLDEPHIPAALEQSLDRSVVANVIRDAEKHDLVGIEVLQQRLGVRVREDVEGLLQDEELAAAQISRRQRLERDRNRVELLRLWNLSSSARPAETVGRIRRLEI